jgi:hypothetical protein
MIPVNSILAVAVLLFVSAPGPVTTPTAQAPPRSAHPAAVTAGIAVRATLDPAVAEAGQPVVQSVVATNTGLTPLLDVRVTSDVAGSCLREVPLLLGGATASLSCRGPASASRTATATATGTDVFGGRHTATATDALRVLHPGLAVGASASPAQDVPGEAVGFPVVLHNSGDAPLSGLALTGAGAACPAAPPSLAAGASATVRCTTTARGTASARFTATGHDELGTPVSASATAGYTVLHPALALTVTAPPGDVGYGASVPVTVRVRNTGEVGLTDVRVTGTPAACARTLAALPVGGESQYTCTLTVTGPTTVDLTASAVPAPGGSAVGAGLAVTGLATLRLTPGAPPTSTTPPPPGRPAPPAPPASSSTAPPPLQAAQPPPPAPPSPGDPAPAAPHRRLVPPPAKGPLKTAPATTAAVIGVLGVLVMTVTVGAFTSAARPR